MTYTIFDYCAQVFAEERAEEERLAAEKAEKRKKQRAYWAKRKAAEKEAAYQAACKRTTPKLSPQEQRQRFQTRRAIKQAMGTERRSISDKLAAERARAKELTMETKAMAQRVRQLRPPKETSLGDYLAGKDPDAVFAELMRSEPLRARAHAYAMRVALHCLQRLLNQQALCGCCSAMNQPIYETAGTALKNAARLAS